MKRKQAQGAGGVSQLTGGGGGWGAARRMPGPPCRATLGRRWPPVCSPFCAVTACASKRQAKRAGRSPRPLDAATMGAVRRACAGGGGFWAMSAPHTAPAPLQGWKSGADAGLGQGSPSQCQRRASSSCQAALVDLRVRWLRQRVTCCSHTDCGPDTRDWARGAREMHLRLAPAECRQMPQLLWARNTAPSCACTTQLCCGRQCCCGVWGARGCSGVGSTPQPWRCALHGSPAGPKQAELGGAHPGACSSLQAPNWTQCQSRSTCRGGPRSPAPAQIATISPNAPLQLLIQRLPQCPTPSAQR